MKSRYGIQFFVLIILRKHSLIILYISNIQDKNNTLKYERNIISLLKSTDKQLQKSLNKDRRAGGFVVSVSKS